MDNWKDLLQNLYSRYNELKAKLDELDEKIAEARRSGIITVGNSMEVTESNLAAAQEYWQGLLDAEKELNALISEVENHLNNLNKVILKQSKHKLVYQVIKTNNSDLFENSLKELLRLLNLRLASKLALLKWKVKGMSSEDFPSVTEIASNI